MEADFFAKPKEHSRVKMNIVSRYFEAWANVIVRSARKHGIPPTLTYIDLFCGPGRYEDGTESTPLLVLRKAIQRPDIREALRIVFNDICKEHIETLKSEIAKLPGISELRYPPQVLNQWCLSFWGRQVEKIE
jgi:three-Cys-motif partner protein